METKKCPTINYHISYDEDLNLKDLEDLIRLIRISNNSVLNEFGLSKQKGNSIQKVSMIKPGSINILLVLSILANVASFTELLDKVIKHIKKKINDKKNKNYGKNTHPDKPIYHKFDIDINCDFENCEIDDLYFNVEFKVHNTFFSDDKELFELKEVESNEKN